MSHSSESSTLPTNEQIIDEITENLTTKTCLANDSEKLNNSNTNNTEENMMPVDFDATDSEEPPEPVFDDFIDEEQLKTLESTLSDEEKLSKRNEAFNLKTQGNDMFKQEKYEESIVLYTDALQTCPLQFSSDRAVLYANRAASKGKKFIFIIINFSIRTLFKSLIYLYNNTKYLFLYVYLLLFWSGIKVSRSFASRSIYNFCKNI